MPGNFRSGRRPKKPTEAPSRGPRRPKGLRGDALSFWTRVIKPAAHLGASDSVLCELAATLWALSRAALVEAKANPTDRHARMAATSYTERFSRTLAQLGLDPLGRARLKPDRTRDDVDPLQEFLS